MRIMVMGQAGVGKTRLVVKAMNYLKGKTVFLSEMPAVNIRKIAPLNPDIDIKEQRPSVDILSVLQERYDNVIIDHWLRIRRISSLTVREELMDIMEQSKANWIILSHTLKGKTSHTLDNGKYTSGLDAVIDIGFGIIRLEEDVYLRIIKDRYWLFPDRHFILEPEWQDFIKNLGGE
jgi:hypothetical protein